MSRSADGSVPPWLLVIDAQRIFADPTSAWASPEFPAAWQRIQQLARHIGPERTVLTRWLPTADRSTAWGDYFRAWPFADVPPEDPLYALVDGTDGLSAHRPVDEPTFGKWGSRVAALLDPGAPILLSGVSTDCCVVTTALAAADAGRHVHVVADACAASSAEDGAAALQVMGLFPPQIRIVDTQEVLAGGGGTPEVAP
ncbi:MAG: isochorismatase family protein [Brachybacterium sp.]|nr:isochorismatase family protein [Brachybacterium sp.]